MNIHVMDKNFRFTQVSDPEGWKAINSLYKLNPTAGCLFVEMIKLMDNSNALIASMSALGARIGKTRQTVSKAVQFLSDQKYIIVYKSGSSNIYTLNAAIVWKDKGYKRYEAELNCAVLINLDEQDDNIKRAAMQNDMKTVPMFK